VGGNGSQLLEQCLLIRRAEEKIVDVYASDLIQSPVHLSIGQEAAAVGLCAALRTTDPLFSTYRSHAYFLAKGGSLHEFFAELMGRATGCCGGKGGSMHLADPSVGFMGTSAIVASSLSNAAGVAWAKKADSVDDVVVAVIGDGALEEGVYHEVLNFASLHNLPLILVVEDNGWAVHSSVGARQAFQMEEHARAYGVGTYRLGPALDPRVIAEQFAGIVEATRNDRAPRWVHLEVFRVKEHVGPGDDFHAGYRNKDDCQRWLDQEWSSLEWSGRHVAEERVSAEIAESFTRAASDPFPDRSSLFIDVVG